MAAALGCSDSVSEQVTPGPVQQEVINLKSYNYLLYMPSDNSAVKNSKYPAIIFLHGIGERGNDLQQVKNEGLPKILDGDKNFPFIVISPQCPVNTEWYYTDVNNDSLMNILYNQVIAQYPIDTNRVYLTGLSMGGIATWYFSINHPTRYAAIAPISARCEPWWDICRVKNVPVWAFHGAKDDVVPLSNEQQFINALKDCGGNVKFTIYPDLGHDSWTVTYNNNDLYKWFLQQSK